MPKTIKVLTKHDETNAYKKCLFVGLVIEKKYCLVSELFLEQFNKGWTLISKVSPMKSVLGPLSLCSGGLQ